MVCELVDRLWTYADDEDVDARRLPSLDSDNELTAALCEVNVWAILPEPDAQSRMCTLLPAPKTRLWPLSLAIKHVMGSSVEKVWLMGNPVDEN